MFSGALGPFIFIPMGSIRLKWHQTYGLGGLRFRF